MGSRCEACEGAPHWEGYDEGVQNFGGERKDRVDALAQGVDDVGGQVEAVRETTKPVMRGNYNSVLSM